MSLRGKLVRSGATVAIAVGITAGAAMPVCWADTAGATEARSGAAGTDPPEWVSPTGAGGAPGSLLGSNYLGNIVQVGDPSGASPGQTCVAYLLNLIELLCVKKFSHDPASGGIVAVVTPYNGTERQADVP